MEGKSVSMNYWRSFFGSTEADIFEVIEHAIMLAAVDFPIEFRDRRDGIAEKLFSCRVSKRFGCNTMEIMVPDAGKDLRVEEGGARAKWEVIEKGSKVDGSYSYSEAEVLTELMDEESRVTGEVLRLKEVLLNSNDQPEAILYESLRRLQLMQISFETLKVTEIGRPVNDLRKHKSMKIGRLARILIEGWKEIVDKWVENTAVIAEHYPNSVDPALLAEEDGLPTPPMDEGELLATQSTSILLSEIFDGLDDDGNFIAPENTLKSVLESRGPARCLEPPRQFVVAQEAGPIFTPVAPPKPQSSVNNSAKPYIASSESGRPPLRPTYVEKPNGGVSAVQRKPSNIPVDKSKDDEEASFRAKLELSKRKLHEGYKRVENEKRQRTIQIVEFQEPPKQPEKKRGKPNSQRGKPKSHGRNSVNSRH